MIGLPVRAGSFMRVLCPVHRRWTFIRAADGSVAVRQCPECSRAPACAVPRVEVRP